MNRAMRFGVFAGLLVACTPGGIGVRAGDSGMDAGAADASLRPDAAARRDASGRDAAADGSARSDAGPGALFEAICGDGQDQDGDRLVDCTDPDCEGRACDESGTLCAGETCGGCRDEVSETRCGDGADEDCDGLRDCADPDCDGVVCGPGDVVCAAGACPCASGFTELRCDDGTDDDCDGVIDCADPDCNFRTCAAAGEVCLNQSCVCPGAGSLETLCDGVDNNCNLMVDEMCPVGVGSCCPSRRGPWGSLIGTGWSENCPSGSVLIGIAGRERSVGGVLEQLQPICAALDFDVEMTTSPMRVEYLYSLRRGPLVEGAPHGTTGDPTFRDECPGDQVAVGVRGYAAESVTQVSLVCGDVHIARGPGFNWEISVTLAGSTPSRGVSGSGGAAFEGICPGSSYVTALDGRENDTVTQLSFACRRFQLVLR